MKLAWTVGGALFGRMLFGKMGMVAGGVLGYTMAPKQDSDRGVRPPAPRPEQAAETLGTTAGFGEERYPEETILDAMRESEETEETLWQEEIAGETGPDRQG